MALGPGHQSDTPRQIDKGSLGALSRRTQTALGKVFPCFVVARAVVAPAI
jgi:hypothetical protein